MARTDQELNMLLAHYEWLKNPEQDMLLYDVNSSANLSVLF